MHDNNNKNSQETARAIKLPPRQTVDVTDIDHQDPFLSFLVQCPLISCKFTLSKCDPVPLFLYSSEPAEDIQFTSKNDRESQPVPLPPQPPFIEIELASPISPTTAGFSSGTAGGQEDDCHFIGNNSLLPTRRKLKYQGIETLIIHPRLRDTEGAVKEIAAFNMRIHKKTKIPLLLEEASPLRGLLVARDACR